MAPTATTTHHSGKAAERQVTMTSFSVTVIAADEADALARVTRRLPDGFAPTGRTGVRSERHMLRTVEVAGDGNVNDAWVVLTSYGMTPSDDLGSFWQTVPGVGR